MAHAKPGKFKCDKCSFSCCSKPTLNGHKLKIHEKAQQIKRPAKTFQCEECSSTFHTNTKFKLHKKTEHHEEEDQPESPPITPEHKKKKEDIGEEITSKKKDMVTQTDKEEKSINVNYEEMIKQIEVLKKKVDQRNENIRGLEKVIVDKNVLLQETFQEVESWKKYGSEMQDRLKQVKSEKEKTEKENEQLGMKYIEVVNELKEFREVKEDEFSITDDVGMDTNENDNSSSSKEENTVSSRKEGPCKNKEEENIHKNNCCAISYGECEYKPPGSHDDKHTTENIDYFCTTCGESLGSYVELMIHRRDNHEARKTCRYFLLGQCIFDEDTCWYSHRENVKKQNTCNHCKNTFTNKNDLMNHIKDEHKKHVKMCKNKDKCVHKDSCWFLHEQNKETSILKSN